MTTTTGAVEEIDQWVDEWITRTDARRALRDKAPHWVYRCFDATGRLIYVGCTWDLPGRFGAHRSGSWWAGQVANVRASVHSGRVRGRVAESEAILTEHPRWNTQGRWPSHPTWSEDEFRDYVYASLRYGHSTFKSRLIVQAFKEYERRFGMPLRDERIDPCVWANVCKWSEHRTRHRVKEMAA